jgi:uncharacterized membrane protein YdjX (TVP38/TMEM64 family)
MTDPRNPKSQLARFGRWLPLALLLALAGLGYGLGLHHYLTLETLAANREALHGWIGGHLGLGLAAYMLLYVVVVALSIPGATVMSIAGGFLFGWALSIPATLIAAVAGAVIVFEIVKTSFGAALAERAGPLMQRLSWGFSANAFSLLLFLRLTPVFPFWAVNAVAGLCRIPLRSFIAATALGIIPGCIAFALVGAGLDAVIDQQLAAHAACTSHRKDASCSFDLTASSLLSPELGLGLTALGLVALIPLGLRLWNSRQARQT